MSDSIEDLIERLRDEADLCRNEGADDVARLLDAAADALEALQSRLDDAEWEDVPEADPEAEAEARLPMYYVDPDGDNSDGLSLRTAYRTLSDLDTAHPLEPGKQIVIMG